MTQFQTKFSLIFAKKTPLPTRNPFTRIGLLLLFSGVLNVGAALLVQSLWVFTALQVPIYLFLSYRLLLSLGRCPLKWRKQSIWIFIILFAHAYWTVYLLYFIPNTGDIFGWKPLFAAAIGTVAGIRLRLRKGYEQCDCQRTLGKSLNHPKEKFSPFSGIPEIKTLITHHPQLPAIIAKAFGWKTVHLVEPGKWSLSLICTGKSMVSLPHFSYDALYSNEANTLAEVEKKIKHLHFDKGFTGIEIRRPVVSTPTSALKTVSWLTLKDSRDEQWKSYSSNLRSKISRAQRQGFHVIQGREELLNDFYNVYSRHMRALGSGALSKKFFALLLSDYTEAYTGIFLVKHNNKTIGAAFNLAYGGFYENGWFATLKPYQKYYPSYLLHHQMIIHAINIGCGTYSFGRSTTGGGVHQFKKQWGTTDIPLQWISYPRPIVNLRHQNWIRTMWKHLPYPLGNHFGNYIAKWVY